MKSFPSTFLRRRRLSALGLLAGVGAVLVPTAARAQSCPPGSYCYYAPPTLNAPLISPDGFGTNIVLASPAGTISGTYSVNGGAPSPFSVTSGTPLLIPFAADEGKTSGYLVPEKRGTFIVGDSSSLVVDQRMIATY